MLEIIYSYQFYLLYKQPWNACVTGKANLQSDRHYFFNKNKCLCSEKLNNSGLKLLEHHVQLYILISNKS